MNNKCSSSTPCKRLEGKVALITGGASGIGESTARLFVLHGATVAVADVQDDLGDSLCKEIGCDYVHCDVSKETDVQNAVDNVISKHGKLDIFFSNAGISGNTYTSISSINYEEFKRVFDVNVYGAFLAAKHAARVMIPAKRGSIIFTASVASVSFGDTPHTYTASKNAVVGLAKSLCVELGCHGIRVNCISPFGVATNMMTKAFGDTDKKTLENWISESANLKGVVLEANDVSEAALYLGSDESKYVSGLNLVLDGGYSMANIALQESRTKFFP